MLWIENIYFVEKLLFKLFLCHSLAVLVTQLRRFYIGNMQPVYIDSSSITRQILTALNFA